jgi:hypothetical protein
MPFDWRIDLAAKLMTPQNPPRIQAKALPAKEGARGDAPNPKISQRESANATPETKKQSALFIERQGLGKDTFEDRVTRNNKTAGKRGNPFDPKKGEAKMTTARTTLNPLFLMALYSARQAKGRANVRINPDARCKEAIVSTIETGEMLFNNPTMVSKRLAATAANHFKTLSAGNDLMDIPFNASKKIDIKGATKRSFSHVNTPSLKGNQW